MICSIALSTPIFKNFVCILLYPLSVACVSCVGPLFMGDSMDFYNLELKDTNVVDGNMADLAKEYGVAY